MCKHGCTVVFKPKKAYMITKDGKHIPFTQEKGLYFIPLPKQDQTGEGAKENMLLASITETVTTERTRKDARVSKTMRQTMRILKRADYHPKIIKALKLDTNCLIESMGVRECLDRVRRKERKIQKHEAHLRRSARLNPTENSKSETEKIKKPIFQT